MTTDGVYRCVIVMAVSRPTADDQVRTYEGVTDVYGSQLPRTVGRAEERIALQRALLREARQRRREQQQQSE
jgi:hypothetical protein